MTDLFEPMTLSRGPAWKNRFMLAPLTNSQSHADGTLANDEYDWLVHRATGGFGMVMTCAAHVQAVGQGFAGQLGAFSDDHLPGLTRMAGGLRAAGAVSSVQLHHAGIRSPKALIGETPRGPSDNAEFGARAMTLGEIEQLTEDFIAGAVRCEKAGFDGVELHGAHGYVLCAFLSPETNLRTDRYGGSLENRARLLNDIIDGVRARTRPDFQLGLRLSPERFGIPLAEARQVAQATMTGGKIDYLDMSLWSVFKAPNESESAHRPLVDWFADLPRGDTRLGVAGKLMTAADCRGALAAGVDFAVIGRAGILHHDFPRLVDADPDFQSASLPVTREWLAKERLGPVFIDYMAGWKGFVAEEETADMTT